MYFTKLYMVSVDQKKKKKNMYHLLDIFRLKNKNSF